MEPDLGTLDDLKHFVQAAHEHGLYVILDWVANHTAWDCNLVTEHPEWYARDWKGDYRADAVVGLGGHHRPGLRQCRTSAST